jgi:hypothetical protein
MVEMTKLTPIERLEALSRQRSVASARTVIRKLIDQYDVFLEKTNEPEAMMVLKFADREKRKELAGDAAQFGDLMFEAISTVGNGSQLHRMLLV